MNVSDDNLEEFLRNEHAILMLGRSNCDRFSAYRDEVQRFKSNGGLAGTTVGALMLDQPGISRFKRDNLWLMSVDLLPYTLLYQHGTRIDGFPGHRGYLLLDHSRRIETTARVFASLN